MRRSTLHGELYGMRTQLAATPALGHGSIKLRAENASKDKNRKETTICTNAAAGGTAGAGSQGLILKRADDGRVWLD